MRARVSGGSRGWLVAGCAALAVAALGLLPTVSAATPSSPAPVGVPVQATRVWTNTGLKLRAGDSIAVTATGEAHFGKVLIERVDPTGIAWGPHCRAIAQAHTRFPAPGLSCWSLIARIGHGRPFEIGAADSFRARTAGVLFLGANDDNLADNSGGWSASVVVTVAAPVVHQPAGPVVVASRPAGKSRLLLALLGGVVVVVLVLLLVLLRRRSRRREPTFALARTVLIGRVTVRIMPDKSIRRIDAEGEEQPFVVFRSDFVTMPTPESENHFTMYGLQFRAVKSGKPFGAPHGEVAAPGQYVAGSAGVIRGLDGGTAGRIALTLRGDWVFALGDVTRDAEELPTADGEITMFIRVDETFGTQADAVAAAVESFLANLDIRDSKADALAVS